MASSQWVEGEQHHGLMVRLRCAAITFSISPILASAIEGVAGTGMFLAKGAQTAQNQVGQETNSTTGVKMTERVLLDEKGVRVTNKCIVIYGRARQISSIISVDSKRIDPKDVSDGVSITIGGTTFWIIAVGFACYEASLISGSLFLLIVFWIIARKLYKFLASKVKYDIQLSMSNGEAILHSTNDAAYHERILRAISAARAIDAQASLEEGM
jgi:hypothetical protein